MAETLTAPSTPNCDRIDEGYGAIKEFLEFLADKGLIIVPHADVHKVIGKAVQAEVLLAFRMGQSSFTEVEQKLEEERIASETTVARPDPAKLLDELYEIDSKELEAERRALLAHAHTLSTQANTKEP